VPGSSKPGPLGSGGTHDVIDQGTLCRYASPKPGSICATQVTATLSRSPDGVSDWPLRKKVQYIIEKVSSHLPSQPQAQFERQLSPGNFVDKMEAMAHSRLMDIRKPPASDPNATLRAGVFGDLQRMATIIGLAKTKSQLDEAAIELASKIEDVGVEKWFGALAEFQIAPGGGGRSTKKQTIAQEAPVKRPTRGNTPLPPLSFDPPAPPAIKTWIEIQLVDKNGKPVAGEKYSIKTPDGTIVQGMLDGDGVARIPNIDPGSCVVSFPDIDGREWNPA
jgi:hypothetical protein